MNRHYLEKLGLPPKEFPENWCSKDDKRQAIWAEEREKYGFDSRQIWSLDMVIAMLIYERLCMYNEFTSDTMTSHHTDEYKGKTITFQDGLEIMIEKLGFFILNKFEVGMYEESLEAFDEFLDVFKIFYDLLWC